MTAFVQDMGVYHRCADVFVAKKFLDGANIITGLKQVRSKGVMEGVATCVLDYSRIADCFLDCPLKNSLVDMVTPFFTGHGILSPVFLRKDPLPAPFLRRIGIFAVECAVHKRGHQPMIGNCFFPRGIQYSKNEEDCKFFWQNKKQGIEEFINQFMVFRGVVMPSGMIY